jgi:hypothetical protein
MAANDLGAMEAGGGGGALGSSGPWTRWGGRPGLPHVPRGVPTPAPPNEAPQTTVNNFRLAMVAATRPATLTSGWAWTPAVPRRATLMLDTGASHCFLGSDLARALQLLVSATAGPTTVTLARPDASRAVPPLVVVWAT